MSLEIPEIKQEEIINKVEEQINAENVSDKVTEKAVTLENEKKTLDEPEDKSDENIAFTEIKIKGMVCESCEQIISKKVMKLRGVDLVKVNYREGLATITYNKNKVSAHDIRDAIKNAGYNPLSESESQKSSGNKIPFMVFGAIALILLIGSYFLLSSTFGALNISIPQIDAKTSIIIIFFVGLLTGFHCIGMCGSFILSYTAKARQENQESLNLGLHAQYAIGKTLSYTIIGGLFGLVGSVFVFSPELRAGIAIFAGIFLIIFGLKMLDVHPIFRKFGIPQKWFDKIKVGPLKKSSNPLLIGLANGLFIACGPLQAMYIIAMASGSFIAGATLLFAFGVGTLIPMMGFGVFASFISHSMQNRIVRFSAVIVLLMGLFMINNGLALSGNQVSLATITSGLGSGINANDPNNLAITNGSAEGTSTGPGYQIINMDVTNSGYSPNSFVLKRGVPVKWVINGKQVNSCNGSIIAPSYNLKFNVVAGEQTIEFTPDKAGVINWSCWMGMIQGQFIVRDDVSIGADGKLIVSANTQQQINAQKAATPVKRGSCSMGR